MVVGKGLVVGVALSILNSEMVILFKLSCVFVVGMLGSRQ